MTPRTDALPDPAALQAFVDARWQDSILPALMDYVAVPAKSPAFDPEWQANGHIEQVVQDAVRWGQAQSIAGLVIEVIRLPGRTPLIWFDAPATGSGAHVDNVLMYGHLDKQPEFSGWREGLGPWTPRVVDDRLYGRGAADDGYAFYASLLAVRALDHLGIDRPRCVGLIETCEESGSYDLPAYVAHLQARLGKVALVVCLDSGAGNYDQLWVTNSLRGLVTGTLEVRVLEEGVHSGDSSGVVPDSLRVLRALLDRLEDSASGHILPADFHCDMPAARLEEVAATARILGANTWRPFPWAQSPQGVSVRPVTQDPREALLNRTWRPALTVTGAQGLPPIESAGNVLRPATAFKLSLRLPPLVDAVAAGQALQALLEADPPGQADVRFHPDPGVASGWDAPALTPWLAQALEAASQHHFGAPCAFIGQGGTIPLMNLLQSGFPQAQFMVCGVLGPESNAHGPNEFLHIPFARRLTAAVAQVMAAMAQQPAAH